MYGFFHLILKDMVISKAGIDKWDEVLVQATGSIGADEARTLDTVAHNDQLTIALIHAVCHELQLTIEDGLQEFGRHFVVLALRSGSACAHLMRSQGDTFPEFLTNVNNLHSSLECDHPDARFPFLDVKYDNVRDCVHLTYLSQRSGLSGLLLGILEEIGRGLYALDVSFEAVAVPQALEEPARAGRAGAWIVTWQQRQPERGAEQRSGHVVLQSASFWKLHATMAEFARLLRKPEFWVPCGAGAPQPELPVQKSSSLRKLQEMERGDRSPEHVLLRATRARYIAAAWSDPSLPQCRAFWRKAHGAAEDYELSEDAHCVDIFVSHCWGQPCDWTKAMGTELDYADIKSTTLASMAKAVALMRGGAEAWGDVTLWVDKACIPQDNRKLKQSCISLIESFIRRCDKFCVIFTWNYLGRLWCVWEWACVLVDRDLQKVWLQNELLVTERTLPLYLNSICNFSLCRTKCAVRADRELLHDKINECYTSKAAFEELVKATAVALMARSMAFRAGRSAHLHERFFTPCVKLAEGMGFTQLAAALGTCNPAKWRAEAVPAATIDAGRSVPLVSGLMGVSASKYHGSIKAWFDQEVSPVLHEIRQGAIRQE